MTDSDDEYLWSKSGAADPEVARLEALLGRFAHDERAASRAPKPRRYAWIAAGAAALIGGAAWMSWQRAQSNEGYAVSGVEGVSRVDVGDELAVARSAKLVIAGLGDVRVDGGSRLRVVDAGERAHRLYLERGTVHASIFAKPREFQIATPAGLSVDLGCNYDLSVDASGATTLAVTLGRVAFETEGRKVWVPNGASCRSLPGRGPDTPIFEGAEPSFVEALRAIEFDAAPDEASIARVLAFDRPRDTLSLFHLLDAPSRDLRERVQARLLGVHALPDDVTPDEIVAANAAARERWRREFEPDWR